MISKKKSITKVISLLITNDFCCVIFFDFTRVFDDKSVQSLFSFDGSFWAFGLDEKGMSMLYSVLTILFSLAKMIANRIDTGIKKLYTLNLLSESVDSILSTAQSIWNQFFNMFGLFFFAMVIMYVVKDYYFKSGGRTFVRLFIFFILVMAFLQMIVKRSKTLIPLVDSCKQI